MKATYVANKSTREFHSIRRQKPECNVKEITEENRVEFKRGKDAVAAKFDACGHCSKYWKSRDNK